MRKYILFIGICLLGLLLFCFWYFNINVIFQRKFHFELPKTVEIIRTSYSFYYDSLKMKVSFGLEEYQMIVEGIKNYTETNHVREVDIKNDSQMSPIRVFCKFWEEEKEEAMLAYRASKQGRWGAKTRHVCILITKDKENKGQYFLHIYY